MTAMAVLLNKKSLQALLVASCAVNFSSFAVRIADTDNANLTASEDRGDWWFLGGGEATCHAGSGSCVWTTASSCKWSAQKGECTGKKCYYPKNNDAKTLQEDKSYGVEANFEDDIKNKIKKFQKEFKDEKMCQRQLDTLSRFDGDKLSLEKDWDRCTRSYYKVAVDNDWCPKCGKNEVKKANISPNEYSQAATQLHMDDLYRSCNTVAQEFSGGAKDIVLFVANTPRKEELTNWMNSTASKDNVRKILDNFKISGTASTTRALQKDFKVKSSQFITSSLHAESGPKGGDIQGASLMATHKVRALFFFQSWATECHRCDIQGMVQICMGAKKNGQKIDCAFTEAEATKVAAQLAKEVKTSSSSFWR